MTQSMMVDLETLDTVADATIVSIGACLFDSTCPEKGILDEFYRTILFKSTQGSVSQSTLYWWMKQSEEAREAFNPEKAMSITLALKDLEEWTLQNGVLDEVWSKGADFDLAILQLNYAKFNMNVPWNYKATRCYRTIEALMPEIKTIPFEGTAHNALEDAKHQVKGVWRFFAK